VAKQVYLTFLEHLEELRKRLLISLGAVAAGSFAGYFYSEPALRFLLEPIQPKVGEVYFFSPAEAFLIRFKIAFLIGLISMSPVVITQAWLFVSPAFRPHEKKFIIPLVLATSLLFISGALFCFYVTMPYALHFLVDMQTPFLRPMLSVKSYIDFLFGMLLAFGISFVAPLFLTAFSFLGVTSSKTLLRYQRQVILIIFIGAAVMTPTPDFTGQILLAFPLLFLFYLSILACRIVERLKGQPA
jgi:sec-independent protein translocase protein TatC